MTPDAGLPASATTTGDAVRYCRTCRRALNSKTASSGRVTYHHAAELRGAVSDHAARTRSVTTEPTLTQQWGQRWTACESCSTLIEARDLYGLIGRVADAMPAKYTRGNRLARVRGELHGTFSNVLATLQPGRGRITPEHPLGVWEPTNAPTGDNPVNHEQRP